LLLVNNEVRTLPQAENIINKFEGEIICLSDFSIAIQDKLSINGTVLKGKARQ
jgi:hypothetical protein